MTSPRATSFQYQFSYIRSLPPSSPAAQSAAMEAVAAALRLPSYFDFDSLFRLDAVVAAKDHELFALLQIFLNDSLAQYKAWADSHAGVFAKYGACAYLALSTSHFFPRKGAIRLIRVSPELDNAQLERKIRLLTLATLGFQNMGRDVSYSTIASALQVEPSQVESWVIDGMCSISSFSWPLD